MPDQQTSQSLPDRPGIELDENRDHFGRLLHGQFGRPRCEQFGRLHTEHLARPVTHAVEAIERVFSASPVMSAMRFVELSREACAVLYAERGRIAWMKPSRTFPGFLAKDTPLPIDSLALNFFERGALANDPQSRAASSWLGASSKLASDAEIVEHARLIPEPGWGGVLSLLWIPKHARAIA